MLDSKEKDIASKNWTGWITSVIHSEKELLSQNSRIEGIILGILNHRLSLVSKLYAQLKDQSLNAQKQSQFMNEKRQVSLSRIRSMAKDPTSNPPKRQISEFPKDFKNHQSQQLMLLKKENEAMFQEYSENLSAIATAESSIAEIVRLQTQLHETLIFQASSIERILDTSTITFDNVSRGNQFLTNAANGSNLFRWIIVCLLISLSLILIFLHLYA